MNGYHKKEISKICLVTFIMLLTLNFSYARIMGNFGEIAYDEPIVKSEPLNAYIIEGAGNFLQAYSEFMLLLNRIEMADIEGSDYTELRMLLERSIDCMEKAKEAYAGFIQTVLKIPYKPAVIHSLIEFNYSRFREIKGFNPFVFQKVESYLSRGDVTGIYLYLLRNIESISKIMSRTNMSLFISKSPPIEKLWRINQKMSEIIQFGQYSSEIFYNILYKN